MLKQFVIASNISSPVSADLVGDGNTIVDGSDATMSSHAGLQLAASAATPAEEASFWGNFILFVMFFAVLFLWTRGGIQWWERCVDPLFPSSLGLVSDIMQLGIGVLALMSALTVAFNICDLWMLVAKRRRP